MKRQVNACRLLTPGPVSIESSVLEAMTCCPSPGDAAFISMMEDVRRRLRVSRACVPPNTPPS